MRHLDLFSGIGGFALAARWVGWETIGFCEIEPYCQKVLKKHWPDVPIYEDVKDVTAERLKADGIIRREAENAEQVNDWVYTDTERDSSTTSPRQGGRACGNGETQKKERRGRIPSEIGGLGSGLVITGGFPCQDISYAGKGAGIDGERSGLWTELARIIGEVRPRYAVLENVAALLSRGLDRVAGDLAEIGYDCEWHCIPASAVGAPHRRDRIWIVAYPNGNDTRPFQCKENGKPQEEVEVERGNNPIGLCADVADTIGKRGCGRDTQRQDAGDVGQPSIGSRINPRRMATWNVEPDVGRVANGVPSRVDRLKGLGNAIVPQVAEVIFRAINEVENA